VKAIFSRLFRDDLAREEAKYREISERVAGAFHERVAGQTREIIRWEGGDHAGPHGFPCRKTKPFPCYIYYDVRGDTITSWVWFTKGGIRISSKTCYPGNSPSWLQPRKEQMYSQMPEGTSMSKPDLVGTSKNWPAV
jgi:hypothetical protein